MTSTEPENPPAEPDAEEANLFEGDWVRIVEYIDANGDASLHVSNSELLTPWKMLGMLQASTEFQSTMTTNIFYGHSFEDMACADDEGEDDEDEE